jgi:hypothetical protein
MSRTPAPHLFVGCEGALYDTRNPAWHLEPPLRENYARHHRTIRTVADLKSCLRAGNYAWPGGYALAYLTDDGATLSPAAVRENLETVFQEIRDDYRGCGWRVVACFSTADCDEPVRCAHTSEYI